MAERKSGLPVDPTSPLISQILSPLVPMSYQVDKPYSVDAQEVDGAYIYSENPMQVSDPQFGTPPIISGGIDFFKSLLEDPTGTASGIATAVSEELEELPRRQIRTAMGGGETYNPETGEVERFDPLSIPATTALGTAASIARVADDGSTVLGIMGGRRAQTGSAREATAKSLKAMGKSEDDIFRANKAFFDSEVLGSDVDAFRFEIPTKNSSLNPNVAGEVDISYGSGTAFGLKEGTPTGFFTEEGDLYMDPAVSKITRLGDVLDFEELYTEYPEMRGVEVIRLVPRDLNNPFEKAPEAFFANADESPTGAPLIGISDVGDPKTFQSILLHEVQHGVQNLEGLPRGGSAKQIFDQLVERYPEVDERLLQAKAIKSYETLYGETEARVVQNRFENPDEALLNPVASRRKEMVDTDVSMDELDAVDRVDEDDLLEEAAAYNDEGIAPFAGMIGKGISESRQKKPRRFLTSQDLGGNKQGIRGLAHGVSYKDRFGDKLAIPEDTKNNFGLDFLESYPLVSGKYVIPKVAFVRQAGFDNDLVQEITGKQATSSEIKRPGFSLSTDPSMSYRKFAGITSTKDSYRDVPYQEMDSLLVASPGLIPRTAVQDLSPAQYLLAAYDPAKPITRKPNTAYTESEIHVGNEESRDISLRKPTARETQDFLRVFEANEQAAENITAGLGDAGAAISSVVGQNPNDLSTFIRAFNRGIKNAVPSFDALQGADMNAYVDQEGLRAFANRIIGGETNTVRQEKVKQALNAAHGTLGDDLFDAAERYTNNFYKTRQEAFKEEVRDESKKVFQNAVQNQLTGRNEDVSGFFLHGNINPVSGGHIIEFQVPFEIRKRLDNYDMSLRVYQKEPNSISKKNLDFALEDLKEVPSYERFVYPDSEGVLQLRQNLPVGDYKIEDQFNRVASQFEDLRTGKITLKAMEEIIDRNIPISFAEPFRQIAQNMDRVTTQYLQGINKSPKGAEFNQAFRDTRAARDEMVNILRQMNAVNNDVNYMPKYRKALFTGGDRQTIREAYKPQVIGPRTGAKLYEKGGPVRAGIGNFIPYMQ